jgi:hypothetical protein
LTRGDFCGINEFGNLINTNQMQFTLAILDNVSNTEGVTYQTFLTVIGIMLTVFITVNIGMATIMFSQLANIQNKLDKLVTDNGIRKVKDYKDEVRAKALFKHLGIPDITELVPDEEVEKPKEL